jgi:phosphoglucosamine mutase
MIRQYFGTDGVRGLVGEPPITPELVLKLGWAAGLVLAADTARDGVRPGVLIGKDTRISGYMLEAALEAGLSAAGVDVYLSGPLPTPAVAYLTRALRPPPASDQRVAKTVRRQRDALRGGRFRTASSSRSKA